MENFSIGEIIWAKIRGYPWWPAQITAISEDNKEKKYTVGFIGDNTHAVLPKPKLAKFMKEYKNYSKTKKRALLESIRIAKELYENKNKSEMEEKSLLGNNSRKNNNDSSNINYNISNNININNSTNIKDQLKKDVEKKNRNLNNLNNNNLENINNTSNNINKENNIIGNKNLNNIYNNNLKNKINAFRKNSNLSSNNEPNEINENDSEILDDSNNQYDSNEEISIEKLNIKSKEMKKNRFASANDIVTKKSRNYTYSLGKAKIREKFTKIKRRRRINECNEGENDCRDLMIKVINYLLYVSKNIENLNIENNKECLFKVLDYLKDYKMENPIGYLKQTSLGIMIKYIQSKIQDKEIEELTNQVYKNFEEQVLEQLFNKNK